MADPVPWQADELVNIKIVQLPPSGNFDFILLFSSFL